MRSAITHCRLILMTVMRREFSVSIFCEPFVRARNVPASTGQTPTYECTVQASKGGGNSSATSLSRFADRSLLSPVLFHFSPPGGSRVIPSVRTAKASQPPHRSSHTARCARRGRPPRALPGAGLNPFDQLPRLHLPIEE